MRTILHILTQPPDELVKKTIERQRAFPETNVEVSDLTQESPDYDSLIDKIFAADSIDIF